jgi:hypothetical protein
MTDNRTRSTPTPEHEDSLVPLMRQHGPMPPFDAVEWNALADKICQAAEEQLADRRVITRRAINPRTGIGFWPVPVGGTTEWWTVAAGWVRPATAAAAAVIAAAILVLANAPSSQLATAAGTTTGASTETLTTADAGDTTLLLGTGNAAFNAAIAPFERDSMFSALADTPSQ